MSKKVFVVVSGCYSDYSIRGIFSTKDRAKRFLALSTAAPYYNASDVEEWYLDAESKRKIYPAYYCCVVLADGRQVESGVTTKFEVPANIVRIDRRVPAFEGADVVRSESYKSAKHALKLAIEARQVELRKNAAKT